MLTSDLDMHKSSSQFTLKLTVTLSMVVAGAPLKANSARLLESHHTSLLFQPKLKFNSVCKKPGNSIYQLNHL